MGIQYQAEKKYTCNISFVGIYTVTYLDRRLWYEDPMESQSMWYYALSSLKKEATHANQGQIFHTKNQALSGGIVIDYVGADTGLFFGVL